MITSVTFDTAIGGDYKRNNRSTRQKSLRCFPSCGIKGHVTGGFCGLPLKVTVDIARESNAVRFSPEDYRFIAEIRPVSQPRISGAKQILEADLLRQIRSKYEKNEANGELFQADSINIVSSSGTGTEMELTFNSQHCSWDYSWKSNRWSGPQEQHVVDIIVLKSMSAFETRVVSFASSSPFVVSSSHKKPVKTNQIKEEDDDEPICLPAAKGRRNVRANIRPEEGLSRLATMNTSTLTVNHNADIRGGYEQPWRQLTMSADGRTLEFSSCRPDHSASAEEVPKKMSFGGSTDQESIKGALALIQLAVAPSAASEAEPVLTSAPTPAAVPAETQTAVRKDKKSSSSSSSSGETAHKRVKTEEPAGDLHHPYGYHAYPPFQYPGYPPYPYPYPYPYPPPPSEEDAGEGGSTSAHYPERDYAAHMHRYPPPPPASHPSYMYPYMPFPYGPPPPPQSSKHAMPPYPMPPPYGLGGYPPHPLHYPPHLAYPGYRPATSASVAATTTAAATGGRGDGSSAETESESEEGVTAAAQRLVGVGKSITTARAAAASSHSAEEPVEPEDLPVAVPVSLDAAVATALAASDGDQKVLKFTKRTQRFGSARGASAGAGPVTSWDGRIAEPPAVRAIAPLERSRAGSAVAASATARSSASGAGTNSGNVTP